MGQTLGADGQRITEISDPEAYAYWQFIQEWGHIDFSLLNFLPQIRDEDQLLAYKKIQTTQGNRAKRTKKILEGLDTKELDYVAPEPKKKKGKGKKGKEEPNPNEGDEIDDELAEQLEILNKEDDLGEPLKARRFEFEFNNNYYVLNIELDENGETITANSDSQARVVSKVPIQMSDPEPEKESVDIENEFGNLLAEDPNKLKKPKDGSVPLSEQVNKYYFQYRIDTLPEGMKNPRICIGICRDDFMVNQDLSR